MSVEDTMDQDLKMNIGGVQIIACNSLRHHVGLGVGFLYSNYWQCVNGTGDMLPTNWSRCCYLVRLQVQNVEM